MFSFVSQSPAFQDSNNDALILAAAQIPDALMELDLEVEIFSRFNSFDRSNSFTFVFIKGSNVGTITVTGQEVIAHYEHDAAEDCTGCYDPDDDYGSLYRIFRQIVWTQAAEAGLLNA